MCGYAYRLRGLASKASRSASAFPGPVMPGVCEAAR
jgi:hypothetical protein